MLPFTPWTTVDDLVDLVDFVAEHSLVGNVDPVHYSIRLLVPEDSLLIDEPAMAPYLGDYVPERLSYDWTPSDQRTDELQRELARIVEAAAASGEPLARTYVRVRNAVRAAAGLEADSCCGNDPDRIDASFEAEARDRPRLTEAWFCCAEPTELQLRPLEQF